MLDAEYLSDPNTQYPIRIDPTVSLTYAESGADAIEDVLLQSGRDSLPEYGGHVIGKSSKGISRLLMRFPGIDFSALDGVTVTYAAVSLRDLLCEEEEMPITCYPFTGDAWTESTADWSVTQQSWGVALSSHIISYDYGEAQPSAFRYFFEITSLAQQWVNGTVDEDLGIILRSTDAVENSETLLYKTFASYERASYKPTFTMTYTGVTVTPDTAEIYQGDTIDLSAVTDPDGLAVTWNSENNAIATVDENGVVTGVAPGEVTITASVDEHAYAVCNITVLPKSIVISEDSYEVMIDGSVTITASTVPAGQSITWSSSNSEVLSQLSGGTFAARKAGTATITAALPDGTSDTCTVRVVLPDGVYQIRNNLSRLYLSSASGVKDGTAVKQYDEATLSDNPLGYYAQHWKIQYLGNGYYTLRPMHFLTSGLSGENAIAKICDIGTTSSISAIDSTERWTIDYINGGYAFKCNGNDNQTLQIPYNSTDEGTSATVSYFTQATMADRWTIADADPVESALIVIDTLTNTIPTMPECYVAPEETRTIEDMGIAISYVSELTNNQSFTFTLSSTSAEKISMGSNAQSITGIANGTQAILNVAVNGAPLSKNVYINVTQIENGIYFLRNKTTEMQADIESQIMEDGRTVHQWEFHGGDTQRWVFTHLGDGTYSICSNKSTTNYYLGVSGDSTTVNQPIVLRTGTITDGMRWAMELTANNAYKLIPKTGKENDRVLATSTSETTDGAILIQGDYIDNDSYRDEWILLKIAAVSYVEREGQKKSAWCWAATARMFAKHYYSGVTYTQEQAVMEIKQTAFAVNEGGDIHETKAAVEYYISNISEDSLRLDSATSTEENGVYSKETLCRFLDDGHVVLVGRRRYPDLNNPNRITAVHAWLIFGYVYIGSEIRFLLWNPEPVNQGSLEIMSYEKLYNGRDYRTDEEADEGIWFATLVFETVYADERIPFYFGEEE